MADVLSIAREAGIAIVTFNREARRNALSTDLARAIVASLSELDGDDAIGGMVLTGAGTRAFCAGVDLEEARAVQVGDIPQWFGAVCAVYRQILLTRKPVVAALNGVAAGAGFQMALVSDLRVAHPGTRIGQPEINAGIPSIMGSHWMRLHLGWSKNQELSMTGRLMEVQEAQQLGIINHLVPSDEVVPKARDVASDLASKPSVAWNWTKARFREIALAGFDETFEAAVLGQQEAFAKGEPQQIMDAFLAKRGGGDKAGQ